MPDPLYRAIAEDLSRKIESGELQPGSQLPTEVELGDIYNASRNTVRDAVKLLATRRLVEAHAGQGTFVVEKIDPFVTTLSANPDVRQGSGEGAAYQTDVAAQRRTSSVSGLMVEIQPVSEDAARALRLNPGVMVVSRHQSRYIDGKPYSLQTSFYPRSLVQRGARRLLQAADIDGGAVRYIEKQLGLRQVSYRDLITVRPPDITETAFFKLPEDGSVSVFVNYRTSYDQDGSPIRLTVTVYPTDRNEFVINVGRVPPEVSDARGPTLESENHLS